MIDQGHIDLSDYKNWYQNLDYEYSSIDPEFIRSNYVLDFNETVSWIENRSVGRSFEIPPGMINEIKEQMPWLAHDMTIAFHCILPGTAAPAHRDHYSFLLKSRDNITSQQIRRHIVFLEPRRSGHIMEVENNLIQDWKAGDWVSWQGNTAHLAANLGFSNRYTLCITDVLEVAHGKS